MPHRGDPCLPNGGPTPCVPSFSGQTLKPQTSRGRACDYRVISPFNQPTPTRHRIPGMRWFDECRVKGGWCEQTTRNKPMGTSNVSGYSSLASSSLMSRVTPTSSPSRTLPMPPLNSSFVASGTRRALLTGRCRLGGKHIHLPLVPPGPPRPRRTITGSCLTAPRQC